MEIYRILEKVRKGKPLVHHITNWVTIYDCANIVKVFGASPVMAHAKEEVADMTGIAQALVLNIGTLTPELVYSMKVAAITANEKNIPEAVGGMLGLSDITIVSGESISMVSEAISARKYVLIFIPEKKFIGLGKQERFLQSLEKKGSLKIVQPDNLAAEIKNIWEDLDSYGDTFIWNCLLSF